MRLKEESVEAKLKKFLMNSKVLSTSISPWVGTIPRRREWLPTPVFLPEKSHGRRSLAGYSPWGLKESDMTEQLSACALALLCVWMNMVLHVRKT